MDAFSRFGALKASLRAGVDFRLGGWSHRGVAVPKILIVDDDEGQRSLLDSFLRSQGFATLTADSGERALETLARTPVSMMISDVRMPGLSGLETMRKARRMFPVLPILLVTGYADVRDAVGAMRDGAIDYLAKPIDLDELLAAVRKFAQAGEGLVPRQEEQMPLPEGVVAESPIMRGLLRDTMLVARSDSRVLLMGESGSGKEVLADLIHHWSARAERPFIKVNCAAIPEQLLESELFGHEKGSFTGAIQNRVGQFELASEGSIFLDEIGEMSPALQSKLLRVTQDGHYRRVGSNVDRRSAARVIAATNLDLESRVKEGRFREDLYYRLNVVELRVPPLRERREDVLPMASKFLAGMGGGKSRLSAGAVACLDQYAWPGNVRELRNAMERAALLSRGEVILPEHLPAKIPRIEPRVERPPDAARLEDVEREAILSVLKEHSYNRTETAKALAISRRALVYKLQRLRELGFSVDPG